MRVISLKNFNGLTRVLLQLLEYHNKVSTHRFLTCLNPLSMQLNVASIPGWDTENDEIICIAELKLGLIGMSCVVPGFATMVCIQLSSEYRIEVPICR